MRVTGVALRGLSLLILWTKALWIITEERWLGSCSLWQAGLDARSRNAVINVQLCKWWMACEGWNLPSTTLAKINRGSAIRADPGLWRYPPFTHVSLDFQLIDWPISRSRADSKTLLKNPAKTFRHTLSYFRCSITLMFTVTLWNGLMCSDGSEWRFVIAFHAIRGEIMGEDHENEEIKMTNVKSRDDGTSALINILLHLFPGLVLFKAFTVWCQRVYFSPLCNAA